MTLLDGKVNDVLALHISSAAATALMATKSQELAQQLWGSPTARSLAHMQLWALRLSPGCERPAFQAEQRAWSG
jgi:hypothetical protein